jgi:Domain of unknown function (DUF4190)/Protein of unknown function (DUF2510)
MPGGEWRADPFRRHEHRYWDGAAWTDHVSDRGLQSTDLPVPSPPLSPSLPAPPPRPGTGSSAVGRDRVVAPLPHPGPVNPFAIAALVLGIVWVLWIGSLLAVIFGHVALSHIRDSGGVQRGRGMAIAGLVLGYVALGLLVVTIAATAGDGDDHAQKSRASCSSEALSLSIAEQNYFVEHGRYTTEAELVHARFASEPFEDFEVRLVPGALDYRIIGVGDCARKTVTA